MLRIVFKDLSCSYRLEQVVKGNFFLGHLLMGVLSHQDVLCRRLAPELFKVVRHNTHVT
jgi:hypothetical protein